MKSGMAHTTPAAFSHPRCPSVRSATTFYRNAYISWQLKRDAPFEFFVSNPGCSRHILWVSIQKAKAARQAYQRWLEERILRDFVVRDGNHAWHKAVREVQKVYPGTEGWLLSCSGAEGGHGRWVTYGGGSNYRWAADNYVVGGWMQFKLPTLTGMFRHAREDVIRRGYRVPRMEGLEAWLSPLAQALAAGWARATGNDASHWSASWNNGCR